VLRTARRSIVHGTAIRGLFGTALRSTLRGALGSGVGNAVAVEKGDDRPPLIVGRFFRPHPCLRLFPRQLHLDRTSRADIHRRDHLLHLRHRDRGLVTEPAVALQVEDVGSLVLAEPETGTLVGVDLDGHPLGLTADPELATRRELPVNRLPGAGLPAPTVRRPDARLPAVTADLVCHPGLTFQKGPTCETGLASQRPTSQKRPARDTGLPLGPARRLPRSGGSPAVAEKQRPGQDDDDEEHRGESGSGRRHFHVPGSAEQQQNS
jgi:hypothetical protein